MCLHDLCAVCFGQHGTHVEYMYTSMACRTAQRKCICNPLANDCNGTAMGYLLFSQPCEAGAQALHSVHCGLNAGVGTSTGSSLGDLGGG